MRVNARRPGTTAFGRVATPRLSSATTPVRPRWAEGTSSSARVHDARVAMAGLPSPFDRGPWRAAPAVPFIRAFPVFTLDHRRASHVGLHEVSHHSPPAHPDAAGRADPRF